MAEIAREMNVATQMGNQGTASSTQRRSVAIVQAGALGPVHEVHVWTNRPGKLWAQGIPRPPAAPIPKNLHWNLWLGPAPRRDFAECYHPIDLARLVGFRHRCLGRHGLPHDEHALPGAGPAQPDRGQAETSGHNKDSYPNWSIITYEFAADRQAPRRQADLV